MAGAPYVLIALTFGIATGVIGRAKGSSFFIWLIVGTVLPILGLIAVILYRPEKLYVQVYTRCGTELYLPDTSEVRHPSAG